MKSMLFESDHPLRKETLNAEERSPTKLSDGGASSPKLSRQFSNKRVDGESKPASHKTKLFTAIERRITSVPHEEFLR